MNQKLVNNSKSYFARVFELLTCIRGYDTKLAARDTESLLATQKSINYSKSKGSKTLKP